MDDPRTRFLQNFDWKSFEQFFGGKFPNVPIDGMNDPSWVEGLMQDVMKKAFPKSVSLNSLNKSFRTEIFQTHNNVIVKVHIPDKEEARGLSAFVGVNRIRLEGLREDRKQTVKLPAHIQPESCKAVYKNGVLQMQLRKEKISERMHEVNVRYLD